MGIYITPFYSDKGPQIKVGRYSKELRNATSDTIEALAVKMKKNWKTLSVEAMYVLSIRLYDLGYRNKATFWHYSARSRQQLFQSVLSKKIDRKYWL